MKNVDTKSKWVVLLLTFAILLCSGCSMNNVVDNLVENGVLETTEKVTEKETQDLSYLKEYYNLIAKYEKQYGKIKKDTESNYLLKGLCYANLVDFNNDGLEELVLAYGKGKEYSIEYKYEVWACRNGKIVQAGLGTPVGYDGNSHEIVISQFNGKKYLVSGGGDQSMWYEFYGFDDKEMKKNIELSEEYDGEETTVFSIDGVEVSEEEYIRTYNSRWLHAKRTDLYDSSENNQIMEANRKLIEQTKMQCKNCQISKDKTENKKKKLEVSGYLRKLESLSNDLNMEKTDSENIMDNGTSYAFGTFYLENNDSKYYIKNDSDNGITLYGMNPGDNIGKVKDIMTNNGWKQFYEYDKVYEYVLSDDSADYFVEIQADDEGKISYWEIYNYAPTYVMEDLFKQMRIESLSGWRKQYYDYLLEIPDNHNVDNLEVQYLYIDDNNIPEMLINYGSYADGGEICYMSREQMKVQIVGAYSVSYMEKGNLFMDAGGQMDVYYDDIFSLKDGKVTTIAEGDYGARDNSNVQFDEDGAPIYEYYWNDKLVTQEKYENNRKKAFDNSQSKSPYEDMMTIWEAQEKLLTMK